MNPLAGLGDALGGGDLGALFGGGQGGDDAPRAAGFGLPARDQDDERDEDEQQPGGSQGV